RPASPCPRCRRPMVPDATGLGKLLCPFCGLRAGTGTAANAPSRSGWIDRALIAGACLAGLVVCAGLAYVVWRVASSRPSDSSGVERPPALPKLPGVDQPGSSTPGGPPSEPKPLLGGAGCATAKPAPAAAVAVVKRNSAGRINRAID